MSNQILLEQSYGVKHPKPDFVDLAPDDEQKRRDYYVRLITYLSFEVSEQQMQIAIQKAREEASR